MQVSVPLRGYGFEIVAILRNAGDRAMFPSPYGDMVLKFDAGSCHTTRTVGGFRPLTGIWF